MSKKLLAVLLLAISTSLVACGEAEVVVQETVALADEETETVAEETKKETPTPTEEATPTPTKEPEVTEEVTPTPTEEVEDDGIDWDDITKYDEPKTMYAQKNVNIRKGPGTDFEKAGSFKLNDEVTVIGKCNKEPFYEIKRGEEIDFVHSSFLAEEMVDLEALKAQQEAEAMALIQQQREAEAQANQQAQNTAQPAAQPAPVAPVQAPAGILFIGDSRCVQMQEAVGGIGTWICEGGKRYEWFAETAIPKADPIVGKGTKVVICMGVNDPGSFDRYAALANAKAAEWAGRGAKTYFVSVNPVWENPWVTQEQVDRFNANIPGMLSGVRWIDTASVLKINGFKLVDGLHYDTDTYVYIFNLIAGSLR